MIDVILSGTTGKSRNFTVQFPEETSPDSVIDIAGAVLKHAGVNGIQQIGSAKEPTFWCTMHPESLYDRDLLGQLLLNLGFQAQELAIQP